MTEFQKWPGGLCPVPPRTEVDVVLRGFGLTERVDAHEVTWQHGGQFTSIEVVEWRLSPPYDPWKEVANFKIPVDGNLYSVISLLRANSDKRLRIRIEACED